MDFTKENDVIITGLKKIIKENGKKVFDDARRAKAMISDYFPRISHAEKNLLNIACESGIYKMVINSSSRDDKNTYLKAKTMLVDDYMIGEQAAGVTVERMFMACGKKLPQGISSCVKSQPAPAPQPKPQPKPQPAPAPKPVQQAKREEEEYYYPPVTITELRESGEVFREWEPRIKDFEKRLNKAASTPQSDMQRRTLERLVDDLKNYVSDMNDMFQADDFLDDERQVKPMSKKLDRFHDSLKSYENDVRNSQPTELGFVYAGGMSCSRNTTFTLPSMWGPIWYKTNACLSYQGKQYIVATMTATNMPVVFVVYNNMLFPEQDQNIANLLGNYCLNRGLMN